MRQVKGAGSQSAPTPANIAPQCGSEGIFHRGQKLPLGVGFGVVQRKKASFTAHRLWGRKTKKEFQHYIETGIWGSYETAGIRDKILNGKPIPLFEDTELKEQTDSITLTKLKTLPSMDCSVFS